MLRVLASSPAGSLQMSLESKSSLTLQLGLRLGPHLFLQQLLTVLLGTHVSRFKPAPMLPCRRGDRPVVLPGGQQGPLPSVAPPPRPCPLRAAWARPTGFVPTHPAGRSNLFVCQEIKIASSLIPRAPLGCGVGSQHGGSLWRRGRRRDWEGCWACQCLGLAGGYMGLALRFISEP